jgi:hypothetical protein
MTDQNTRFAPPFASTDDAPKKHIDREDNNDPVGTRKRKENYFAVTPFGQDKDRVVIEIFMNGCPEAKPSLFNRAEEGQEKKQTQANHCDFKSSRNAENALTQ